jgi:hypothetical protein
MNRGKGIDKPPVLILFVSIHASERGSISLVLYYHSCLRLCGRAFCERNVGLDIL